MEILNFLNIYVVILWNYRRPVSWKIRVQFQIIEAAKFACMKPKWIPYRLVWGLRLWRAERAPVWELSWYWLELSALKNANANIKFLEDSFWNNNHTYTDERYLNLDLFICNHKSWMSPWAEILMIHVVKNWGTIPSKSLDLLRLHTDLNYLFAGGQWQKLLPIVISYLKIDLSMNWREGKARMIGSLSERLLLPVI